MPNLLWGVVHIQVVLILLKVSLTQSSKGSIVHPIEKNNFSVEIRWGRSTFTSTSGIQLYILEVEAQRERE